MAAPPETLSSAGKSAASPHVAADAAGNVIAAWTEPDGADDRVRVALRPAGGAWQDPVTVSGAGSASQPRVSIDAGDAVVAWYGPDGAHARVRAAVRPAGGAWEPPQTLSSAGQDALNASVALRAGAVVATWRRGDGSHRRIQAATRAVAGAWSAPATLSAAGQDADSPVAALDDSGAAIAVWRRFDGAYHRVQAATRPAGGDWDAPVTLSSAGQDAGGARVATRSGTAVAVWYRFDGSHQRVEAAVRGAAGAWAAPQTLSAADASASQPDVAVAPGGTALAVWRRASGGSQVQAASRPGGADWQPPSTLSAPGEIAGTPAIAADAQGNAVAAWSGSQGDPFHVATSVRATGAPWEPPLRIATTAQVIGDPRVAMDAAGNAVAAWTQSDGANTRVRAATFRVAACPHAPALCPAPPPDPPGGDACATACATPRTAPSLRELRATRARRGARVAFRLSAAAPVRLALERCAKARRGRCRGWTLVARRSLDGQTGANRLRLAPRRRLGPGRHRVRAVVAGGARRTAPVRSRGARRGDAGSA